MDCWCLLGSDEVFKYRNSGFYIVCVMESEFQVSLLCLTNMMITKDDVVEDFVFLSFWFSFPWQP